MVEVETFGNPRGANDTSLAAGPRAANTVRRMHDRNLAPWTPAQSREVIRTVRKTTAPLTNPNPVFVNIE